MSKKIGYVYKKDPALLIEAGAEKVYADMNGDRQARTDMFEMGLRRDDTLLLLYLRDLGGSPVADRVWSEKVEAIGATIEIVTPEKKPAVIGRPRKYDPTPELNERVRALWLDGSKSERVRLREVAVLLGYEVSRGVLNGRYGWPSNPK